MENAIGSINKISQKKGSYIEDRDFEITQSEENKGERMKRKEGNLWDTIKRPICKLLEFENTGRRGDGARKLM